MGLRPPRKVARCVQVAVVQKPAGVALKHPFVSFEACLDRPTGRTTLAAREPAIGYDERAAVPLALVFEHPPEPAKTGIENRAVLPRLGLQSAPRRRECAARGTRHTADVEVLNNHTAVTLGQSGRQDMKMLSSYGSYTAMGSGETRFGFATADAASVAPRDRALQTPKFAMAPPERARSLYQLARRDGCDEFDAYVDAHCVAVAVVEIDVPQDLACEGDEPTVSLARHRGAEDPSCSISSPTEETAGHFSGTQPAQARQGDVAGTGDTNCAGGEAARVARPTFPEGAESRRRGRRGHLVSLRATRRALPLVRPGHSNRLP